MWSIDEAGGILECGETLRVIMTVFDDDRAARRLLCSVYP